MKITYDIVKTGPEKVVLQATVRYGDHPEDAIQWAASYEPELELGACLEDFESRAKHALTRRLWDIGRTAA